MWLPSITQGIVVEGAVVMSSDTLNEYWLQYVDCRRRVDECIAAQIPLQLLRIKSTSCSGSDSNGAGLMTIVQLTAPRCRLAISQLHSSYFQASLHRGCQITRSTLNTNAPAVAARLPSAIVLTLVITKSNASQRKPASRASSGAILS